MAAAMVIALDDADQGQVGDLLEVLIGDAAVAITTRDRLRDTEVDLDELVLQPFAALLVVLVVEAVEHLLGATSAIGSLSRSLVRGRAGERCPACAWAGHGSSPTARKELPWSPAARGMSPMAPARNPESGGFCRVANGRPGRREIPYPCGWKGEREARA